MGFDVIVIGAGVVGLAIARFVSMKTDKIALIKNMNSSVGKDRVEIAK